MSKEDVLRLFRTDLNDPGSWSGEYLEQHVLQHARRVVAQDRPGLLAAVGEWLGLRRNPETLMALAVIEALQLTELRSEVEQLRSEIDEGRAFKSYYTFWVERALNALDDA